MKLQILSDLHSELCSFKPISGIEADVVVLAGDIGRADLACSQARCWFPDREIVFVPGNHEYYRFDRKEAIKQMRIDARQHGIHLLDNDEAVIGGVRFLGATLWTDFEFDGNPVLAMADGQCCLNDFRMIREGKGLFTPARSVELHRESVAWLESRLAEPFDGKTVVVSHHLPSALSVAERFRNSPLNPCFASNLDRLFGKMDLWIHGHTHHNVDYMANGTRVVCNPRGYMSYSGAENPEFDPGLVIEV